MANKEIDDYARPLQMAEVGIRAIYAELEENKDLDTAARNCQCVIDYLLRVQVLIESRQLEARLAAAVRALPITGPVTVYFNSANGVHGRVEFHVTGGEKCTPAAT